jgi:predicted ATPase
MLTRVYIDNFRSFVNFEYRPEKKQLLLGPNGSGKSSLLDAISYLKKFLKGSENPFTQSTRTRWQDRPSQVLEIDAFLRGAKYEYRVEIRCAPETKRMSVAMETLKVSGELVFEFVNGEIHFFSNERVRSPALPLETDRSALHLSLLSNSQVRGFVEWTESVHCFRVDAYPSAMEESADREERQPECELENLASWYRYLVQAHPDENLGFLNSLKQALDGFQSLRFSSEEDGARKLRASFASPTDKKINYSIAELSEGQRCLIALYMILHFLIAKGHTVFIDEPDNFIALREIQPWLFAAEAAVDDHHGQLILISHHPEILNQWASEHGLRFFREENGHVRTEKFKADPQGNLQPSELIARGWEDE